MTLFELILTSEKNSKSGHTLFTMALRDLFDSAWARPRQFHARRIIACRSWFPTKSDADPLTGCGNRIIPATKTHKRQSNPLYRASSPDPWTKKRGAIAEWTQLKETNILSNTIRPKRESRPTSEPRQNRPSSQVSQYDASLSKNSSELV